MSGAIGVFVIHGMGSQRPGYSADLVAEITRRLGDDDARVRWQEAHWAYLLKDREDELWEWMQQATEPSGSTIELDWRRVREFVVHNFGDALAYQRDWTPGKSAYLAVHENISNELIALKTALDDPQAPIVVMAHSLGAHMMSNYIWDRQHPPKGTSDALEDIPTLTGMITFGCNIPLFSLSFPVAKPITLPGKRVRKPSLRAAARWLNFLDRDDVLAWPLRPLYEKNLTKLNKTQKRTVARIEDREINVGSLVTSWNPGVHGDYWTDNDFTKIVAEYLKRLILLLDGSGN